MLRVSGVLAVKPQYSTTRQSGKARNSITIPFSKCSSGISKRDTTIYTCETTSVPVIRIGVGTPRDGAAIQEFNVLVDTGGYSLLLPSNRLPNLSPDETFDPSKR